MRFTNYLRSVHNFVPQNQLDLSHALILKNHLVENDTHFFKVTIIEYQSYSFNKTAVLYWL